MSWRHWQDSRPGLGPCWRALTAYSRLLSTDWTTSRPSSSRPSMRTPSCPGRMPDLPDQSRRVLWWVEIQDDVAAIPDAPWQLAPGGKKITSPRIETILLALPQACGFPGPALGRPDQRFFSCGLHSSERPGVAAPGRTCQGQLCAWPAHAISQRNSPGSLFSHGIV